MGIPAPSEKGSSGIRSPWTHRNRPYNGSGQKSPVCTAPCWHPGQGRLSYSCPLKQKQCKNDSNVIPKCLQSDPKATHYGESGWSQPQRCKATASFAIIKRTETLAASSPIGAKRPHFDPKIALYTHRWGQTMAKKIVKNNHKKGH